MIVIMYAAWKVLKQEKLVINSVLLWKDQTYMTASISAKWKKDWTAYMRPRITSWEMIKGAIVRVFSDDERAGGLVLKSLLSSSFVSVSSAARRSLALKIVLITDKHSKVRETKGKSLPLPPFYFQYVSWCDNITFSHCEKEKKYSGACYCAFGTRCYRFEE